MRRVAVVCATLAVSAVALSACSKKTEGEAARTGEAATASAAAPAGPVTPPKRKPGLWLQKVSSAGTTQETKLCLDEATEAKMTVWGQAVGQEICSRNTITPAVGGWKIDSECDFGDAGKNVSTGMISGDFNTRYTLKMTTTTTGAKMAQVNGAHEMEMSGEWQGACPADMKPGDMMLPGGMKMNINQIAAMQKAAGK
ncbi:DUF3617 family protein [Phenylobacterium sp.]|uniref:DUF3617 domain-containing protein n=1 Tax=Phenylobacterium sp. TaxID=1871053 RepID=UPI0025EC259C|nr:DUF3617 family protein [Phenylobacterium sp.]MBX3484973.1 DUF3617 family protein [Phenylobacterium sp.]MCW5758724.1 DUF3617 family protein [Phenylobacterium sp.]